MQFENVIRTEIINLGHLIQRMEKNGDVKVAKMESIIQRVKDENRAEVKGVEDIIVKLKIDCSAHEIVGPLLDQLRK